MDNPKSVGVSVDKYDVVERVIGRTQYTSDIFMDYLYASILRSPVHHGKITKLNIAPAENMPGVVCVVTAEDVPGSPLYGRIVRDRPALAKEVVRHLGEPIAIVVAKSRYEADMAASSIEVEIDPLPSIFDVREALSKSAPKIHSDGNVAIETRIECGNIKEGFQNSDVVVEGTLKTPRISPAYLETEAAAAEWNNDESITIYSGTQNPFQERGMISNVLGMPENKVNIIVPDIGGSFGAKCEADLSILAALAAWKSKSKVRIVNTREESMLGHTKRHPALMHYRLGAKNDGSIIAIEADILLDSGAYGPLAPSVGAIVAEMGLGPYKVPNVEMVTKVVYTNGPPSGTIRSAGGAQATFGIERMMDILSEKLKMDPIILRRKNIWDEDDHTSFGVRIHENPHLDEIFDRAAEACEKLRSKPCKPGMVCGVGVATSFLKMGLGYRVKDDSTNRMEWKTDGHVKVHLGAPDLGQGLKTIAAQITAETLGIAYDMVEVGTLDTSTSPNGGPTNTSRSTFLVGNSVVRTCNEAINELLKFASVVLGISKTQLSYRNGKVILSEENSEKEIPASYFASQAAEDDSRIIGEATYSFPHPEETPGNYRPGMPHVMFTYGAQVARVEIDPELGIVTVTDIVSIHDVGKAINPKLVEGQIEGGAAMGIGYALSEAMKLKSDGTWTSNFLEYNIPTLTDVPNIVPVIIENYDLRGPYGARGIGESSTVSTAPAIANAVRNAVGIQILEIPIDPCVLSSIYFESAKA